MQVVHKRMSDDCEYKPLPSFASEKYPGELKHYPTWETATKITIVAIVDIVAIVGNILIIVIVLHSKKMRTATNYYIMNLSFADLLVACFPIWIHIVDDVTEGWVVGEYFCKFNPFIQSKYIFVRSDVLRTIVSLFNFCFIVVLLYSKLSLSLFPLLLIVYEIYEKFFFFFFLFLYCLFYKLTLLFFVCHFHLIIIKSTSSNVKSRGAKFAFRSVLSFSPLAEQ